MGLPVPSDMDGRVLSEILTPAAREARPVEIGPTVGIWSGDASDGFVTDDRLDEDESAVRERLRALGYLE
jgi:hypothetical protein